MLRLRRQPNPQHEQRIRQKGGLVDGTRRPLEPTTTEQHSNFQHLKKGTKMKKIFVPTLAAGALASAALGLAGSATAAPSGPSPVDATVSQLQAQGFNVIVSRVDTAAVDCTLSAVRPGQTFSRTDSGVPGADDDLVTTVTNKTVYVDIAC
jgi:hypothetical protein